MEYSYPPEPGSVIIHNEAEQWSAVKPEINANEAAEDGRAIKLMVAVGAQLPEHFLSDGDNSNLATAKEMGFPISHRCHFRIPIHPLMDLSRP